MCYSIGEGLDHMANRMLEIPYKTPYKQLQDIINNKYNIPVQIQYIDDDENNVLVDSDLVLRRAI